MTQHINPRDLNGCAALHLRLALEFFDRGGVHLAHVCLDHKEHLIAYADDVRELYAAMDRAASLARTLVDDLSVEVGGNRNTR